MDNSKWTKKALSVVSVCACTCMCVLVNGCMCKTKKRKGHKFGEGKGALEIIYYNSYIKFSKEK